MLSSGTTFYHLGLHVIIWDAMLLLSSGANVIIWDKMLSSGANVIIISSGANVVIWCYHVMLSSGMITHPFFIFPKNFTHSLPLANRLWKEGFFFYLTMVITTCWHGCCSGRSGKAAPYGPARAAVTACPLQLPSQYKSRPPIYSSSYAGQNADQTPV